MNEVPGPESTGSQPPSNKNLGAFQALFPGLLRDGALDAHALGEILDVEVAGLKEGKERFGLMWAGRQKAIEALQTPTYASLVPNLEDTSDWATSQNVFIEGDNLEVLKLLQNAYNDQVNVIYIDPPYNTGNDFVYNDDFSDPVKHYLEVTGQVSPEGNRLVANTDLAGRKHSNWLTMMYPRLVLARNLLTQDGTIFVSIDDNEVHNLRAIMDQIFGEENFVASVIWEKTYSTKNDAQGFSKSHEYLLVYKRNIWTRRLLPRSEKNNLAYKYDDGDGRGLYRSADLTGKGETPSCIYPIKNLKTGTEYNPPTGKRWLFNSERMTELLQDNRIFFGKDGKGAPSLKRYLNEVQDGVVPNTLWRYEDVGHTDQAAKEVKDLIGSGVFDYPKPVDLIRRVIQLGMDPNGIILDFFAGSGTTGQAVMAANEEDGGNRKFVLVTLDEPTEEKSAARASGYETVSQITRARLGKAAEKLKVKLGLRTYRVGPSNFSSMVDRQASDELDFGDAKTLKRESSEVAIVAQVSLLLGCRLDEKWLNISAVPGAYKVGSVLVYAGDKPSSGLLEVCEAHDCRTLAVLEDSFANKDDVKANLYFACKKANVTFKTF